MDWDSLLTLGQKVDTICTPDEIKVLRAAKRNLEELQLQIAHLPHPPTR
jgi:lysyl-tRNA synthetase class I